MDFLVLGANGMQGSLVVRDLLEQGRTVFTSDLYAVPPSSKRSAQKSAPFAKLDLRDTPAIVDLILKCDPTVVVNCAEGDWNLEVYLACLETERHCIDLGSTVAVTEKQLGLHEEFQKISRTAITGCGSTPGINNVMLAHASKLFDSIERIDAGFAWDSNIKQFVVPFSIESVLEEILEPAPYIRNGRWKKALPMQTIESRYHQRIGFQNEFLVHHPEVFSFHHYFPEAKDIRFFAGFPEHSLQMILALAKIGFNDRTPIRVRDTDVVPIEFLTRLLKDLAHPVGYEEVENLWVQVDGTRRGKPQRIEMECLVPTLDGLKGYGCNIDTGLTASIIAQMLLTKTIKTAGSFAPEAIIPEKPFFSALKKRGMRVYENGALIN